MRGDLLCWKKFLGGLRINGRGESHLEGKDRFSRVFQGGSRGHSYPRKSSTVPRKNVREEERQGKKKKGVRRVPGGSLSRNP